ncbi:MAG: HPr family phosphocarrier protein [Oscillibacter sp.]|nr:HPr family phosphocarrier protein [Oscillibacter sp.]
MKARIHVLRKVITVEISNEQVDTAVTFFIKKANEFSSRITVSRKGNTVNAKSLLGLLSLQLTNGTELLLEAEGGDAAEALEALEKIMRTSA